MKHVFNGRAEKVAGKILSERRQYGVSIGRRAPMHRMHLDCILEIADSGLTPIIVIGSTNGAESALFNPLKNPLTADQQKEQLRIALQGRLPADKVKTMTLEDHPDDNEWMKNLVKKIKDMGGHEKSVIHFRAKSVDAAKAGEPIKPLSRYARAFVRQGFSVWHSYNSDPADDNVCASDIRDYDLNNLTKAQRETMAAPDYIIGLARLARANNPDRALLEQHGIPLTVFDLTLDRMHREAGIRTGEVIDLASKSTEMSLGGLKTIANDIILKYISSKKEVVASAKAAGKIMAEKKPLLLLGNSISPETARTLGDSGLFDIVPTTVSKYQSGENYVEFFKKQEADFTANAARIKGAKVVIVQSTGTPVGDHVQDLLELIHTAKFHGAAEVTAVIPFAAFSRQDRAFDKRLSSVGADLFARQLKAAGADRVITFTMHSQAAIQFYKNVFGNNFANISAADSFAAHFRKSPAFRSSDFIVGAPDGAEKLHDEGQGRARDFSKTLTGAFNEKSLFRISKVHTSANETKITHFDGDVAGRECIVIDDMVDGGTTMVNAAKILKEKGAKSVTCAFTHAVLTQGAGTLEKLLTADTGGAFDIDRLVMTDSIPESAEKIAEFAKKFPALAQKIEVIFLGDSIVSAIGGIAPAARQPANKNKPCRGRKHG